MNDDAIQDDAPDEIFERPTSNKRPRGGGKGNKALQNQRYRAKHCFSINDYMKRYMRNRRQLQRAPLLTDD